MNKLLKTTFILLLTLFGANSSFSQSLVWEKVIGAPNATDRCFASGKVSPSLYVFGGYYYPDNLPHVDAQLIFTDAAGSKLYTKINYYYHDAQIKALIVNPDKTIIAAGHCGDTISNTGALFAYKVDSLGNVLWQQIYKNTNPGNYLKIEATQDGYLLASDGYQGDDVLKIDKQGNLLWKKSYGANTDLTDISLMKDGSYLACGYTIDKSSSSLPDYHELNPILLKLKPNGDTIRTKIIGSFQNHDIAHEAKQTADGGVIVVGRYVLNSNPTKMQGLVMKFDSAWNQQWSYTIMPPHGTYDEGCELFNVQQLADSNYIVSGNYYGLHSSGFGERNGYVAKIAKDGSSVVWQQEYKAATTIDYFSSMFYMNDGSAVFSGRRHLPNNIDFYLVKLKSLGLPFILNYCQQKPLPRLSVQIITNDTISFTSNSFPGTRYGSISTYTWRFGDGTTSTKASPKHKYNMPLSQLQNIPVTLIVTNNSGCTDSVTVYPFLRVSAPDAIPGLQVLLYPNPSSAKATFSISGYTRKEAITVELLDVLGRKVNIPVKQQHLGATQQLEVNTSALPAGLYLYRLYSGNQLLGSGKMVKE